jgi:indoleamine 2,3-dioxygenase
MITSFIMLTQRSPSQTPLISRAPLPPGHFLSLPPSFAQPTPSYPSGAPPTSAHTSNGLAPNVASLASADFEVDVRTGFLPATKNVERLPEAWEVWEEALDAARGGGMEGKSLMLGGGGDREDLWRAGIETVSGRRHTSGPI